MSEPDFKRVCIIGVGLIGGSLAGALKRKWAAGIEVVGSGRTEDNLKTALNRGLIDRYSLLPEEAAKGADLVVLASPVGQYREILQRISASLGPAAVVTDVGSVKAPVLAMARELLPEGVVFVGAHPIAGSEKAGAANARADLFEGSICVITPDEQTPAGAIDRVMALWQALGARVVTMSAQEHDSVFGLVSHLPHLVSYGLVRAVKVLKPEAVEYAGAGFMDTTRIAKSPAELWVDICMNNRVHLIEALGVFIKEMQGIVKALEEADAEALNSALTEAVQFRRSAADDC